MVSLYSTLEENSPLGGIISPSSELCHLLGWSVFAKLPLGSLFLNLKIDIHLGSPPFSQRSGVDQSSGKVELESCSSFTMIIRRFL